MSVTKQAVLETLRSIKGPDFEGDIVSLGLVSEIFVADGKVFFSITVPAERAQQLEPLRAAAER
ncbi:MAG: iron-sulfur cluster assembly protein, partial [Nitratireductor sp.]